MLRVNRGTLRILFTGLILMLGTFGVMWPAIWWLYQAKEGNPVHVELGSVAHWFIGIPVGAQVLLLVGLVAGRTALLETKAWRL